jgi:hypothetical protein
MTMTQDIMPAGLPALHPSLDDGINGVGVAFV